MAFENLRKNVFRPLTVRSMLSSRNLAVQIAGAVIGRSAMRWFLLAGLFFVLRYTVKASWFHGVMLTLMTKIPAPRQFCSTIAISLLLAGVVAIVNRLTPIFSLRRQEERVTMGQITVLLAFGLWLIGIIDIWNWYHMNDMLPVAIVGGVLSIMFQETIRSVVAFFYVRLNHLLAIGDWIEVPSQNVDGMVSMITLTTVTVENWDTTLSTFPTYLLQSAHFINYQRMVDGKTHGRRMMRTFVIDTGWIQPMTQADADRIAAISPDDYFVSHVLPERVREAERSGRPVMNMELYRLYLHHWLMNHPHISRKPRLVVRWLEQQGEGLPLQVYTYIIDSSLEAFEWNQSAIVEHIVSSLALFNLQLYQSPSGYDASNSNIYLTDHEADYKKLR